MGGGFLASVSSDIFCAILLTMFLPGLRILHLVITLAVIALLSMYIIYDTQLIVGGEHKRARLEMDDYVIGAMIIYSDIIYLFLWIMELLGGNR